ncbi:transcriptional regulatory protein [Datura stramonium]|uniref:Transcriptional regulatory protein n=1 Tax=Datura stramonium TaxID=4076 RepID=A0ABS8T2R2_DATST|nr:transcriptional regulatory protein [Datura stramonium]
MTTSFGAGINIAVDDPNPKLQIQRFNGLKSTSNSLLLSRRIHVNRLSLTIPVLLSALSLRQRPAAVEPKRSKVEIFKEQSNFIRYPLNEEILNDAPNITRLQHN